MLLKTTNACRTPTFFMCDECGSACDTEDQTPGAKRNCIYSGEKLPTHNPDGTPAARTSQVYTTCLVCKKKTKVESNCVYQNVLRTRRREPTMAKERIGDPTFACAMMPCRFDTCPSRSDPSKPNRVTFQKLDDQQFKLLYTCHVCQNSWEA